MRDLAWVREEGGEGKLRTKHSKRRAGLEMMMRILLTSLVMTVTSSLSERSYAWEGREDDGLFLRHNPIGKSCVQERLHPHQKVFSRRFLHSQHMLEKYNGFISLVCKCQFLFAPSKENSLKTTNCFQRTDFVFILQFNLTWPRLNRRLDITREGGQLKSG